MNQATNEQGDDKSSGLKHNKTYRDLPDEEKKGWVTKYESSGLTRMEFCRRSGLPYWTLIYWLTLWGTKKAKPEVKFQELKLLGKSGEIALEVEISGKGMIRVYGSCPQAWVDQVLWRLG